MDARRFLTAQKDQLTKKNIFQRLGAKFNIWLMVMGLGSAEIQEPIGQERLEAR